MSQQGRRWFRCETCGAKWRSPAKAAMSQAPETCSQCGASVQPMFGEVDEAMPIDAQGDLVAPESVAAIRGGRLTAQTVRGGR